MRQFDVSESVEGLPTITAPQLAERPSHPAPFKFPLTSFVGGVLSCGDFVWSPPFRERQSLKRSTQL